MTRLGTGFTALVSDGRNALIAEIYSVISGSCHKVVAEVGKCINYFAGVLKSPIKD